MSMLQTGEVQTLDYSERLLKQLQRQGERFGLDTAKMEELTAWVSTATATHSQNICQLRLTLMRGLKDFDWITNDPEVEDAMLCGMLQAEAGVRYAAIVRRPRKPAKVIAYLGR